MTDKIPINGLKTSGPFIAVWIDPSKPAPDLMARFCSMMSKMRSNIAYMATGVLANAAHSFYCIEPVDEPKIAAMVAQDSLLATCVRFGGVNVGLLSIYPHKASLRVFGAALHALSQGGIILHGAASSIAALTFVLDFDRMQEAITALSVPLKLPPNSAPVQADFKIRQREPGH